VECPGKKKSVSKGCSRTGGGQRSNGSGLMVDRWGKGRIGLERVFIDARLKDKEGSSSSEGGGWEGVV